MSRFFPKLRRFCAGSVPVLCRNCARCLPFQCARFVPVSPGRQFLSQIEFLLAFMPRNFDDAFSPRSILRTKPILQSARLVLSHSGNDRYRNIRSPGSTQWGCRSTTPAVRLAPGRRSNELPKQSRSALSALTVRFSPTAKLSTGALVHTCDAPELAIRRHGESSMGVANGKNARCGSVSQWVCSLVHKQLHIAQRGLCLRSVARFNRVCSPISQWPHKLQARCQSQADCQAADRLQASRDSHLPAQSAKRLAESIANRQTSP